MNTSVLRDIVAWDVGSWRRAIPVWERYMPQVAGSRALELGAHRGGLSLYWALRGCHAICSDFCGPSQEARELHLKYGVADRVRYLRLDATRIPLADRQLDIVCFKSVVGSIEGAQGREGLGRVFGEIYRVLKPGGRLLFAENTVASPLHRFLRGRFVEWGSRWRYQSLSQLRELLAPFCRVEIQCCGFAATFGRREWQRSALHYADKLIEPVVPESWKYIAIGCATRGEK